MESNGKKIDINKQGLNSVKNDVVKLNLMGKSKTMEKKDWKDANGRKGKVSDDFSPLIDRSTPPLSEHHRECLPLPSTLHTYPILTIYTLLYLYRAMVYTNSPTSMVPMLMATLQSTPQTPGLRVEKHTSSEPLV